MREATRNQLRRYLGRLPVALLIVVALNQLRLVQSDHLSPWSGGGFGMFASVDSPGSRHLHIFLENDSVRQEVAFPASMDTQLRRALVLPGSARLQQLAAAALDQHRDSAIRWDDVTVEVWRNDYDPVTLLPRAVPLRQERVSVAEQ